MAKTLQMVFQNQIGKNVSISVPEVREDVTEAEIKTLMQLIVAKNIFESVGGDLITIMEANLVTREVQELSVR
jgi:chemotaxis protein CheY-P-specific phosphatase CheC